MDLIQDILMDLIQIHQKHLKNHILHKQKITLIQEIHIKQAIYPPQDLKVLTR